MKNFLLFCLLCVALTPARADDTVSHEAWTKLLRAHVKDDGMVDYQGFKKDVEPLNAYLETLSKNPPTSNWSAQTKMAYWINVYNAFTVKLIVDNYPVESIRDLHPKPYIPGIRTVWHNKFFKIGGQEMSLDEVEHSILRKQFDEPRIHFAINCASYSCPPLRREAYVADRLDAQLTEQAKRFLADRRYNEITRTSVEASSIFNWFNKDFTKDRSLVEYLNQYAPVQIQPDAKVKYKKYDWRLNDA